MRSLTGAVVFEKVRGTVREALFSELNLSAALSGKDRN